MMRRLGAKLAMLMPGLILGYMIPTGVGAWELALRDEVITRAQVVRLADVAVISGLAQDDVERMGHIMVAPGPSESYPRNLTASQIRKVLEQNGVELDECRFSGAARTIVRVDRVHDSAAPAASSATPATPAANVNPREVALPASYRAKGGTALVDSLEQQLADRVQSRLDEIAGVETPWSIKATVQRQALKDLPQQWRRIDIVGLREATEGSHQLTARFLTEEGEVRIPIQADVTRMVPRVVLRRPLKRGDIVQASDVEVRPVVDSSDGRSTVVRPEEVVGHQLQSAVNAGEPMDRSVLDKPILVQRRETIEVASVCGGIFVKTQVRAIDDGAEGDMISVERLDGSKTRFVARVVGYQRAVVFADSMAAAAPARR